MQEPLSSTKPKTKIIFILLILASAAALIAYFATQYKPNPPLNDRGQRTVGVWSVTKINEISSAGFSLWNVGASALTIEKVEVRFNDNKTELVDLVFIEIPPNQGTGTFRGTLAQNGYITYPVEGFVIEPKKEAQLYVSIKAVAVGNHSATRIILTYTYQSFTYEYTYNIESYFTLEVRN